MNDGRMFARYRYPSHPGKWWITDFTVEQVDGRLAHLEAEVPLLRAALQNLVREVEKCLDDLDPCADDPDSKTYNAEMGCSEFHNLSLDVLPNARSVLGGKEPHA